LSVCFACLGQHCLEVAEEREEKKKSIVVMSCGCKKVAFPHPAQVISHILLQPIDEQHGNESLSSSSSSKPAVCIATFLLTNGKLCTTIFNMEHYFPNLISFVHFLNTCQSSNFIHMLMEVGSFQIKYLDPLERYIKFNHLEVDDVQILLKNLTELKLIHQENDQFFMPCWKFKDSGDEFDAKLHWNCEWCTCFNRREINDFVCKFCGEFHFRIEDFDMDCMKEFPNFYCGPEARGVYYLKQLEAVQCAPRDIHHLITSFVQNGLEEQDKIEVYDKKYTHCWFICTVLEGQSPGDPDLVKVHYDGWHDKWDEWVNRSELIGFTNTSGRFNNFLLVQPLKTFTHGGPVRRPFMLEDEHRRMKSFGFLQSEFEGVLRQCHNRVDAAVNILLRRPLSHQ
jgi:hypothetical protein